MSQQQSQRSNFLLKSMWSLLSGRHLHLRFCVNNDDDDYNFPAHTAATAFIVDCVEIGRISKEESGFVVRGNEMFPFISELRHTESQPVVVVRPAIRPAENMESLPTHHHCSS